MATITGLTAARMLAIEAASIVDGDVVGDDLILTKQSGATINAGSVRGAAGPTGPAGSDLAVVSSRQVLDIGLSNQIRAGRQLTAADFTAMGLQAPTGLWNLSNTNDSSGNGRNLTNKGGVAFGSGIEGVASSAAKFADSSSQAFYIVDTGASDPFRIKTGTVGAWVRCSKKGAIGSNAIIGKSAASDGQHAWWLQINASNQIEWSATTTGAAVNVGTVVSNAVVNDDRWHFVVATHDGGLMCIYVDGVLDAAGTIPGAIFGGSAPLNIGGLTANAGTAAVNPFAGRIDEAFVTADVLSQEQIRNLYCVKIAHTLGAVPKRSNLLVRRRKKGAALVAADFPTQPLRLYNFTAGALTDLGSNNQALTAVNSPVAVAGADGAAGNAMNLLAGSSQHLNSTDTGLVSSTSARSFGLWMKVPLAQASPAIISWGASPGGTTAAHALFLNSSGYLVARSISDDMAGPYVAHGRWVFVVITETNAPSENIRRKMYVDGVLVATSNVINAITLGGASRFRIGMWPDGTGITLGATIDSVFICNYVLDPADIALLYAKGAQALGVSEKDPGGNIEQMTSTDLFCVFDDLESQHQIDLAVA